MKYNIYIWAVPIMRGTRRMGGRPSADSRERPAFYFKNMTPQEAVRHITSKRKWYAVCGENRKGESTLRVTALRIMQGTAQSKAMTSFFERLGYKVEIVIRLKGD